MKTVIKVENICKEYLLGEVGTGSISRDLNTWWAKIRGKENPNLKIDFVNSLQSIDGYHQALTDISFDVKEGDVLGIIGKNGAGKSTILKILSRVTAPTKGQIKVQGRIASLLEVGTGFNPDLTGQENIYLNGAILGMKKFEIKSKFDEIVDFSGVEKFIDTPVKRYSSGMYVRLAFAVAAHLEPEILVVDEVLAVGDIAFQNKCLGKMSEVSKQGRTILFVSHNMQAMGTLCTRGILLKNGELVVDCSIGDAIKRYLDEATILNSVYIVEPPIMNEDLNAYIKKIQIEDSDGNIIGSIPVGKGWKVRLFFKVIKRTEHFICGLGISSTLGVNVNTTWSIPEDLEIGEYEGVFEQNNIIYSAGSYQLTFGLSTYLRSFQFVPNAASIVITEPAIANFDKRIIKIKNNGVILNQMDVTLNKL